MRHIIIRGIMGLIWMAAAAAGAISGSFTTAALYLILGGAFLYSAYAAWKNNNRDGKGA